MQGLRIQRQKVQIIISRAFNKTSAFCWNNNCVANFALHKIKRLIFITVVESVYSAVRTGSLNKTVCATSLEVYVKLFSWALRVRKLIISNDGLLDF
jgi:hypothetical protein